MCELNFLTTSFEMLIVSEFVPRKRCSVGVSPFNDSPLSLKLILFS